MLPVRVLLLAFDRVKHTEFFDGIASYTLSGCFTESMQKKAIKHTDGPTRA